VFICRDAVYSFTLLYFFHLLVLSIVNSHKKIRIKSSNSSILCDDREGQLKHRLWQTVLIYSNTGSIAGYIRGWLVGCVRFNVPLDTFYVISETAAQRETVLVQSVIFSVLQIPVTFQNEASIGTKVQFGRCNDFPMSC